MSDIHDKLRRLLRLGESANEHEAARALEKAAELAMKHSIDLGCIAQEADTARITEQTFDGCEDAHAEVHRAARQCTMKLFGVRVLFSKKYKFVNKRWKGVTANTYIGIEHNVSAATFAHAFIVEQCGRDLKRARRAACERKRPYRAQQVRDYCAGWALGITMKYDAHIKADPQLEDSKMQLVIADQNKRTDDYIKEKYADVRDERNRKQKHDANVLLSGFTAGKQVHIHTPIAAPARETLALE